MQPTSTFPQLTCIIDIQTLEEYIHAMDMLPVFQDIQLFWNTDHSKLQYHIIDHFAKNHK
jgi:hypothetical protein